MDDKQVQGNDAQVDRVIERLAAHIRNNALAGSPPTDHYATDPAMLELVNILNDDHGTRAQILFNTSIIDWIQRVDHYLYQVQRAVPFLLDRIEALQGTQTGLSDGLQTMHLRAQRLERGIRALRSERKRLAVPGDGAEPTDAQLSSKGSVPTELPDDATNVSSAVEREGFDYFLFEARYRGTMEAIKERQRAYLDLFHDKRHVLDLGCGRGEFVELLTEQGIAVTGVDLSEDMVAVCRDRGLNVVRADVFDYLQSLPSASQDGIFAAQLVEHLEPADCMRLLRKCATALRPGGIFVVETVNPNYLPAMVNFYMDPTHARPIPANLLSFMIESQSFTIKAIRFTSPGSESEVPQIEVPFGPPYNYDVRTHYDYAVVAVRA